MSREMPREAGGPAFGALLNSEKRGNTRPGIAIPAAPSALICMKRKKPVAWLGCLVAQLLAEKEYPVDGIAQICCQYLSYPEEGEDGECARRRLAWMAKSDQKLI